MENMTLPELLGNLSGHGVYDVAFVVNELPRYGFTYDGVTDTLSYQGRSTTLGARSPKQVQAEMDADPKGGVIDDERSTTGKLVDALDITTAIVRLIAPDEIVPSSTFFGRGAGFRADVNFISNRWRTN